jgi:hypothetical protein
VGAGKIPDDPLSLRGDRGAFLPYRTGMDAGRVIGNLVSWSSTQYYRKDRGADPIELIRADLEKAWGDPETARKVSWNLYLRVGRISPSG